MSDTLILCQGGSQAYAFLSIIALKLLHFTQQNMQTIDIKKTLFQEEEVKMLEELLAKDEAELEKKKTVHEDQEQLQEKLHEEYKEIDVQIRSKIDAGDAIKVSEKNNKENFLN